MNDRGKRFVGTREKMSFGENIGYHRCEFSRVDLLHVVLGEGERLCTFWNNGALLFADNIDESICLMGAH